MKFKLDIELGNAAMLEGHDIAEALRKVASQIEHVQHDGLARRTDAIHDLNGNTVGRWKVSR